MRSSICFRTCGWIPASRRRKLPAPSCGARSPCRSSGTDDGTDDGTDSGTAPAFSSGAPALRASSQHEFFRKPMKHFDTIPERGNFTFQTLVAPHKVSGRAMHDLRGFYGLQLTKGMPFGCVRDEDGEIYAFVRAVNEPGSTPNPTRFVYQSTR